MKKYLIIAFIALGLSSTAQQSPTNKTRSNNDFSQVDNYLIGLKRLGIPTSDTDNLDAGGLPQNAVKLLYNTTTSSLRIYNPVLGIWSEAADLSQYYTRAQIDAAFNTKLNKSGGELNGDLKLLRRPGSPDSYKLRLGDGGSAYVAYEDRSYGQGLALVTGTNENVNVNSGGSINLLPANHINLNSIIVKDFGDNFTKGFSFGGNARFEATNVDTQLQPFDFYVSSGSASTTPGYSIFKIRREGSSPFFDIKGSDGTIIVSNTIQDVSGTKFLKQGDALPLTGGDIIGGMSVGQGEAITRFISDPNGYTGFAFGAPNFTSLQMRYQPNALGRGLQIYDPYDPKNVMQDNAEWKKILVEGDALPLTGGTLTGNLDVIGGGSIGQGEAVTGFISDPNGYTGFRFQVPNETAQVQLRYQPSAFGRGLHIYDPLNPLNTGLGNSDWKRILTDDDAINSNQNDYIPQSAKIHINGTVKSNGITGYYGGNSNFQLGVNGEALYITHGNDFSYFGETMLFQDNSNANVFTGLDKSKLFFRNYIGNTGFVTNLRPYQSELIQNVDLEMPNESGMLATRPWVINNYLNKVGGEITGNLYLPNLIDGQNDIYRFLVVNTEAGNPVVKYVDKEHTPFLVNNPVTPQPGSSIYLGDYNNSMKYTAGGLSFMQNGDTETGYIRPGGGGAWTISGGNTKFLFGGVEALGISDRIYISTPIQSTKDVEIIDSTKGIILTAPSGGKWRVTINDAGDFVKTAL